MKFCAYMAICLSLPFALLAEDVGTDEPETSPEDEVAATPAAQAEGFKRYKSILGRMPFGVPPPGFNPDAPSGAGKSSREENAVDAEAEAAEAEASEIEQQILRIFKKHDTDDMYLATLKKELLELNPNLEASIRRSGVTRFSVYLNRMINSVEVNGRHVLLRK